MPTAENRIGKGEFTELASLARIYAGNLKTVDAIADRTGINRMTVNRILNGHGVNPAFLYQFAIAFQKPLNPLLKAIGAPERHPDPLAPQEELTPEQFLTRQLIPVADFLRTTPEVLAAALQDPDRAAALKTIVEDEVTELQLMTWRNYALRYQGVIQAMRDADAAERNSKKTSGETIKESTKEN